MMKSRKYFARKIKRAKRRELKGSYVKEIWRGKAYYIKCYNQNRKCHICFKSFFVYKARIDSYYVCSECEKPKSKDLTEFEKLESMSFNDPIIWNEKRIK